MTYFIVDQTDSPAPAPVGSLTLQTIGVRSEDTRDSMAFQDLGWAKRAEVKLRLRKTPTSTKRDSQNTSPASSTMQMARAPTYAPKLESYTSPKVRSPGYHISPV